jgi:hypothetical protein
MYIVEAQCVIQSSSAANSNISSYCLAFSPDNTSVQNTYGYIQHYSPVTNAISTGNGNTNAFFTQRLSQVITVSTGTKTIYLNILTYFTGTPNLSTVGSNNLTATRIA